MATRWNSKHTGQKIDDTIDYVTNPNLLDNPNFAVNQRGTTSIPASPSAHIVDRWKTYGYTAATVSVLENGHISISGGGASAGSSILQYLEKPLPAGTYTLSVKVSRCENPNSSGNFGAIYMRKGTKTVKSAYIKGPGINSLTFTVSDGEVDCASFGCLSDSIVEVEYVKLELGSQQTLAHQDADGNWVLNEIPDYGEQLRRCQRYFVRLNGIAPLSVGYAYDSGSVLSVISLPVAMRTNPTITLHSAINYRFSGSENYQATNLHNYGFSGFSIQLFSNDFINSPTLTAGKPCDIYLVEGNYLDISADL